MAAVLGGACVALLHAADPVDTGLQEKVQVTVVQVDVLVMDRDGRTVPDLTKDDFTLEIAGDPIPVTALDVVCPIGAADDPLPLTKDTAGPPPAIAPGVARRVVLAFDYSFLSVTMRPEVLEAAERMLRMSKTPDEEVMIVALAGEVRVEQRFTKDTRLLAAALSRMRRDVTLWARDFPVGVSGESYFSSVATLMDVLESYEGPKAVVFFSQVDSVPAAMQDLFHDRVAAHAAAGRAAIYPAKPNLLGTGGANDTLVRFANQTGGRMPFRTNDLSLSYRRAQRDLSCRYTVAARLEANETRDPRKLTVKLNRPGLALRAPEKLQIFTEDAKRKSRAAAAYVDPGPFERPLVRAFAFPAVPAGKGRWDTLLAVSFPAPVRPSGADVDVRAVVRREHKSVGDYKRRIHVDPPAEGGTARPVTVLGSSTLSDGSHELTVVLSDAGGGEIVSARTAFVVPQVIDDVLMLRGPVLGRVLQGGQFLRAGAKERPGDTRLGKLLGPDRGFEPLLVQEIDAQDELLFYWTACVSGVNPLPSDVVVSRRVAGADGEIVRSYDPVPLNLVERGKGTACLDMLESLPGKTLPSGDYRLEVIVLHPNGDAIARGTESLTVR